MPGFVRRLIARIRYRHFDEELRRELDVHRAMVEDAARGDGASEAEARRLAARQLGNVTRAREDARSIWIAPWIEGLWQDVRYALRGLLAAPSFTLPALIVLVLTMGLTTALYVTVESVFFRPWPLPDADSVVKVIVEQPSNGYTVSAASAAEFEYWRERAGLVDLVARADENMALGRDSESRRASVRQVSSNYFGVLRIPLAAGRGLAPASAPTEVVISHEIWQARFGGRADIVGRLVPIHGMLFTVVGVTARRTRDAHDAADAWVPLSARRLTGMPQGVNAPGASFFDDPRGCCVQIAGRLKPGADRRDADAEIAALARAFAAAHDVQPAMTTVVGTALAHQPRTRFDEWALLSAAVMLTLLLGCANVGNLQLARGVSRHHDLDVRRALGASRTRLVRHVLIETLVVTSVAAAASVWASATVLPAILGRFEPDIPQLLTIDWRTLLFAAVLCVLVCLIAGALPALKTTRARDGSPFVTAGPSRLRSGLLALQIGVSIVLLVGAGLLARGAYHAAGARLGFNPYDVAAVSLGLPDDGHSPAAQQVLRRVIFERAVASGAGPLAGTMFPPFDAHVASNSVRLPNATADRGMYAVVHQVTPGYFEVLGIRLVEGQLLSQHTPPGAIVVNEALARRLWPGQSAIGRVFVDDRTDPAALRFLGEGGERRVVGVVADARTEMFEMMWPAYYERAPAPAVLLVGDEPGAIAAVLTAIRSVAPSATPRATPLVSGLGAQMNEVLIGTAAAAAIATLALVLATIGTLGVFLYVVGERTREIGVRMTLGAGAREIYRAMLSSVVRPLMAGALGGLLAAQALGIVLGEHLYGVSPRDPLAYVLVLLVLLAAASMATFLPARRALRVDPAVTLRVE